VKFLIIGAGAIGKQRANAIADARLCYGNAFELWGVLDSDSSKLKSYLDSGIRVFRTIEDLNFSEVDCAIIATSHDVATELVRDCLDANVNVLVEKPLGRSLGECKDILAHQQRHNQLFVGLNYRFFAGVKAILADVSSGFFGELISVNMILGHGNSPGMEKSWKLDRDKCGGGALIDPGIHLLDLALCLSRNDLSVVAAHAWSGFWKTGIEEEVHVLLRDSGNCVFNIQTSLNRWRNAFRIEVNGTDGYGVVEGRGGNYGPQSYRRGRRWGWRDGISQSQSEEVVVKNSDCLDSFLLELLYLQSFWNTGDLKELNRDGPTIACDSTSGLKVMTLLEEIRTALR
jgi:predicted dehydrogenase